MSVEKKPVKHFRGCWMRAEIFYLIEEGRITPSEAIMVMMIDSLVNSKGEECFASNQYLGDQMGIKKTRVSEMINKLKKLGLVIQTRFDGHTRYLSTAWSHIDMPEYWKPGRPGTAIPEGRVPLSRKAGTQETGDTIEEDGKDRPSSISDSSKYSSNIYSPHSGSAERESDGDVDELDKTNSSTQKNPLHPRWRRFATILGEAISSVRKINITTKLNSWSQAIQKIHTIDGVPIPRLHVVLKWYSSQIRKADLIKDNSSYLPVAYSGGAFREKFLRIEDALKRSRADKERREGPSGPKIHVIRDAN